MPDSKIEVVTLTRGHAPPAGDMLNDDPRAYVEGGGHRVWAPWPEAEREVKRRVLRTLADRGTPPDGIAFVRAWEEQVPAGFTVGAKVEPGVVSPEFQDKLRALGHDLPPAKRSKRGR